MKSFVTRVLDNISPNAMDMSCYALNGLLATALAADSLEKSLTIHYASKDAFFDIELDEIVSRLDESFHLVYRGGHVDGQIYCNENSVFSVESEEEGGKLELQLTTQDEELVKAFREICKDHASYTKANTVFALTSSMDGFYLSSLGKLKDPLVPENYSEEVLEGYNFVVDDFKAEDPHGRLMIINGPPGTGKTYLVKGLISDLEDSTIVVIPPKLISEIDGPSLLPTFINHRRRKETSIVLLIEDADACLAPRASDNISAISSLLNCADGILGAMLDIKIIATTNQERMDFDAALVRPGRLSRHITVGPLSPERATEVYRRLTDDNDFEYTEEKILADVYIEADLATGGKVKGAKKKKGSKKVSSPRVRRNRMGFGAY